LKNYNKNGILSLEDINLPSEEQLKKGVAVIECIQKIPCNPCVDVCPVNAIKMKDINDPPVVDFDKCIGCGKCVGICPGLAIFVIKKTDDKALVTLPYEFSPVPEKNEKIDVLNREGKKVGVGVVKKIVKQGKTFVVTVEVDEKLAMDVRNIKV
jgi:sarcosine oxidase, subunit alpha